MRDIKEEYNLTFPRVDFSDSLSEKSLLKYYSLSKLYNNLLCLFLKKYTSIDKYDNNLLSNGYEKVNLDGQDFYQKLSNGMFRFLYIRNNIHIEKLSQDEMKYLVELLSPKKIEYNDEIDRFIKSTMKKVLFEGINNDAVLEINYGPDMPNFYAPNNALIIGLRYYENDTDEFDYDKYLSCIELSNRISSSLSRELEKIDLKVFCIYYSNNSVQINNEEEEIKKG